MLGRNGEMDTGHAVGSGIGGRLDQMFLDGLARPVGIGMERHQPLGLGPVAEPLPYDGADNSLVVGPSEATRT